jgi:enolase
MSASTHYTVDGILKSLGYVDPMMAARQQARMILLGKKARYQTEIQQLESKWGLTLAQMQQKYQQESVEDFTADDDYAQWQWYTDAVNAIDSQLEVLAA